MSRKYHITHNYHDRDILRQVYNGHTNAITPIVIGYYNYRDEMIIEVSENHSKDIGLTVVRRNVNDPSDKTWYQCRSLSAFYKDNGYDSISDLIAGIIDGWRRTREAFDD